MENMDDLFKKLYNYIEERTNSEEILYKPYERSRRTRGIISFQ